MTDPAGDERIAEPAIDGLPPSLGGDDRRPVCRCNPPGPITLHRTNRRWPARCRACGARISVGELFGMAFLEMQRLQERIAELEAWKARVESHMGLP